MYRLFQLYFYMNFRIIMCFWTFCDLNETCLFVLFVLFVFLLFLFFLMYVLFCFLFLFFYCFLFVLSTFVSVLFCLRHIWRSQGLGSDAPIVPPRELNFSMWHPRELNVLRLQGPRAILGIQFGSSQGLLGAYRAVAPKGTPGSSIVGVLYLGWSPPSSY